MDASSLIALLQPLVPDARFEAGESTDQPTLIVPREHLLQTCRELRDRPDLQFTFLAELTAVDWWPREPRFQVVYHLAALGVGTGAGGPAAMRLRLKVRVPGENPRLPTVSSIWPSANWCEREVWDLFGIVFDDHPDLRRILMPDDWEGHPLRKDSPVQVNLPAQTYEPLQLSPEQFAANIAAAKQVSASRSPAAKAAGPRPGAPSPDRRKSGAGPDAGT